MLTSHRVLGTYSANFGTRQGVPTMVILFAARGGPRRGIGGGPVHHAKLNKRERLAGPSVPNFATPNSRLAFTPRFAQRAERRRRTPRLRHTLSSHQPRCRPVIETDSVSLIGPTLG